MNLEEPERDCTNCKEYIPYGEYEYNCEPMKKEKHYFCTDSTDTAENCKHYKYKSKVECKKRSNDEDNLIDIMMIKLGWYKETHLILGKKKIRFHRGGFELPIEFAKEILNTNIPTKVVKG